VDSRFRGNDERKVIFEGARALHTGLAQTLFFNVCDLPKARVAQG
jgi:hypothetical protein